MQRRTLLLRLGLMHRAQAPCCRREMHSVVSGMAERAQPQRQRVQRGYWLLAAHRRAFFDHVAQQLHVGHLEDWYSITKQQIVQLGGRALLSRYYHGRLSTALKEIFPDHAWIDTRFAEAQKQRTTRAPTAHAATLRVLAAQLHIESLDDWYSVSRTKAAQSRAGRVLLTAYNDSVRQFVAALLPDHPWQPWKFVDCPRNYWNNREHQRAYLEWAGRHMFQIEQLADWYSFQRPNPCPSPLRSLLVMYYNNSLALALVTLYPEHSWQPWKFRSLPRWFWQDSDAATRFQAQYISFLEAELGIQTLSDWYRVSRDDLRSIGAKEFPAHVGGLPALLRRVFPNHTWDERHFANKGKKSTQRRLRQILERLFPTSTIHEEFRVIPGNSDASMRSATPIELDFFIVDVSIALEFQGLQHYRDTHAVTQLDQRQLQDIRKADACQAAGITLIEIPFGERLTPAAVRSLIQQRRPDITFNLQT